MKSEHVLAGFLLSVPGILFGEAILIAPIVVLVAWLGFWGGLAAFIIVWASLGVLACIAYEAGTGWIRHLALIPSSRGLREQLALRASRRVWTGTFMVAILLGPVLGVPFFYALGWERTAVRFVASLSAVPFGLLWVGVYGGIFAVIIKF